MSTQNPTPQSDSTAKAVVDPAYHYRRITKDSPTGSKVILINKASGVATFGTISAHMLQPGAFFDHWAPMPTFE